MLNKSFDTINIDDINLLKENGVSEGKTIDYKEEIHLSSREERKEFAADITSFSNSSGGHLVFGIRESEGMVEEVLGIFIDNVDNMMLQIENILRDMVEPRISNIQMKVIPVDDNNNILLIFIPRSYSGPHIVRGKEFFGRNTAGKYKLEYNEIKRRFSENDTLYREIQNFHIDRIFQIKANQGYMQLNFGSTILLNIVPLNALSFDTPNIDLGSPEIGDFRPLYGASADYHVGFEGIGWRYNEDGGCYGYHHINRNGIVEIVDRAILNLRNQEGQILINIDLIEEKLKRISKIINQNYIRYGVDGPFILKFALLDVQSATFHNQNGYLTQFNTLQNDLMFPDAFINSFDEFTTFTDRVIELLYNAAGYSKRPI